jgi:hypothetical protein
MAPSITTSENGTKTANGHMSPAEEAQWVEKAGWAPRFGQGDSISSEAADGLDHQTWLEGKLEDKFFGGMALRTDFEIMLALADAGMT